MYSKAATEACLRAQNVPVEEGRGRIAESASGGSLAVEVAGKETVVVFISGPSELGRRADAYKRSGGNASSKNNAVIAWAAPNEEPTNDAIALITGCLSATPAPGDEARDGSLSLHDYTAQATTICDEELARFREIKHGPGVEPTLENTRTLMTQLAAVLKTLTDRLSALRPPERVEADVKRMLASLAAAAAGFHKVSEAKNIAEAERRLDQDVVPHQSRAHQIATRIGIEQGCEGR